MKPLNHLQRWLLVNIIKQLIEKRKLTFLFAEVRRLSRDRWYEDSDLDVEKLIEDAFNDPKANRINYQTDRYDR